MFHTSWLSEVFVMGASSEFPSDFTNMIRHLFAVLARTHFDADRILSIAKNLLSEVTELKRSGPEMLTAVSTRLTTPIYTEAGRKSTTTRSNDLEICIFKQEAVLNGVIAEIKAAGESMNQVVAALKEIQTFFINGSYSSSGNIVNAPSFVQVAVPSEASSLSPFCTPDAVAALIQSEWTSQVEAWSNREKMTAGCCEVTPSTSPSSSPFPFPRSPYSPANIDKKFGNAVMVPIAGLQTSFLSMVVPCDVIADTSPDLMKDAHAVAMLCELISRTEGPLYSAVRGNG